MLELSDEELLRRTPSLPAAFGEFYRRHEIAVLRYFAQRVREPELAADMASETFARALLDVRRFDPARGAPRAWLFGIAHNVLLHALRDGVVADRARRKLKLPPQLLVDDALERINRLAGDERVEQLLARLPHAQAEAVRQRVINERPYREIASIVRCSESVVRQRVSRGLATLRSISEDPS